MPELDTMPTPVLHSGAANNLSDESLAQKMIEQEVEELRTFQAQREALSKEKAQQNQIIDKELKDKAAIEEVERQAHAEGAAAEAAAEPSGVTAEAEKEEWDMTVQVQSLILKSTRLQCQHESKLPPLNVSAVCGLL